MSPIEQLKKKLKDLSNQGSQSVNQISRSIPQPVKSFVKPIVQEVSNIATQQIPAAQRFTPLFQPTQNPIAFQNAAKQQIQNFQKNGLVKGAQNFGMDVFNSAKLGANVAGGSKILAGGVVNAAKTILPNAAIGGGINKLSGGSFSEGAGQGVALSPSLRGITAVTNPLIEKGVSRFVPRVNNQVANFVVPRITRGALNVPEGAVIDASLGRRPLSPESMALDFVSGSVLPGNPNAKLRVKGLKGVNPRAFKMHPEDIQTAKTVLDRLRGKMGTVQKEDKEYLMKTLNTLIDTYIPGYKNNKNQDVYKVLENLIYKNEGQGMDKLPIAMGLMAGQKATGYKDAPNKFSAIFDKKPRFEIDDSGAKVIPSSEAMSKLPYEERLKRFGSGQGVTLGEILDHKELYKQYPEIKNVKVIERGLEPFSKGTKASYDPATNTITLNDSLSPSEARKTLLHEIQHAIQTKEGFARGGNLETAFKESSLGKLDDKEYSGAMNNIQDAIDKRIDDLGLRQRIRQLVSEPSSENIAEFNKIMKNDPILSQLELDRKDWQVQKRYSENPFKAYQSLGGELESRSVAQRADLTPEQRRTTLPYSDQGIKNQDVITRYDDGGVAGSIKVKPQVQIQKEVGGVSDIKQGYDNWKVATPDDLINKPLKDFLPIKKQEGTAHTYDFFDKQGNKAGQVSYMLDAKNGAITITGIKSKTAGTGAGTNIVQGLKRFAEINGLKLTVTDAEKEALPYWAKQGVEIRSYFPGASPLKSNTQLGTRKLKIKPQAQIQKEVGGYDIASEPRVQGQMRGLTEKGRQMTIDAERSRRPVISEPDMPYILKRAGASPEDIASGKITVYRATENGRILPGDFVTPDKSVLKPYFDQRVETGRNPKIITQKVDVKDLVIGDEVTDFVYRPQSPLKSQPNVAKPLLSDIGKAIDTTKKGIVQAGNTYADLHGVSPDSTITVYRGVKSSYYKPLAGGEWVTQDKQLANLYARNRARTGGESAKIISQKVKASDLVIDPSTNPGVENEFRYNPSSPQQPLGGVKVKPQAQIKAEIKGFTQPGSITNTRSDQIASKYRTNQTVQPQQPYIPETPQPRLANVKGVATSLISDTEAQRVLKNQEIKRTAQEMPQSNIQNTKQSGGITPSNEDIIAKARKEIGRVDKPNNAGLKETIRIAADKFYTDWIDRYHPIMKMVGGVEKQGKKLGFDIIPKNNPKYTIRRFLGMGGIAEERYDRELKPILDELDKLKIDKTDMDVYLKARRDVGFGDIGREIFGSDANLGAARVSAIEQKYGEAIKPIADKLYAYQSKGFDDLVDAGFVAKDKSNLIKSQNPDYVPFIRKMDDQLDEFLGIPTKVAQQKANPLKKIEGSERAIYSPIESVVVNTFKQRAAIEKNNVAKSIVGLQKIMPELGFERASKEGAGVITVWENGQKNLYQVGGEIAEAVKGMNEEQINGWMKIMTIPASIMRQGATGRNPEFMIPNVVRDQLDAAMNSKYGYIPFVDWAKGLSHVLKQDEVYSKWKSSGASMSFSKLSGRKNIQEMYDEKLVKKKALEKLGSFLGKGLDKLGQLSEEPTRVGLFNKAYKKTGNELIANLEARESSMDFSRMGSKMKVANSVIPFLNVGIQGFDKMIRTARENPAKFTALMGLYGATPAIATAVYNNTFHPEEYAKIPSYVREDNFIIVTGKDSEGNAEYISIPKGHTIQYIANPIDDFISYAANTNKQSLSAMLTQFLSSGTPVTGDGSTVKEVALKTIGQNLPQAIKPVTESLLNKSFFKYDTNSDEAKEIVPYYLKDKPAAEQAYDHTPAMYKGIARGLAQANVNVSPLNIQNVMEGYLAGGSKIPANVIDMMIAAGEGKDVDKNKIPLLRRFLQKTYPVPEKDKEITPEKVGLFNKASASETAPLTPEAVIEKNKKDDKEARAKIGKGSKAFISNNKIYLDRDKNGSAETIDLTPPTKGSGIASFKNDNWEYSKARSIWNDNSVPSDVKNIAFKKLGVKPEDVRYDALANYSVDIKTQDIMAKSKTKEKLIENIKTGRKRSIGDKIYASDDVINNLVDEGRLTKEEAKELKAIDYDKSGKLKIKAGGKGRKLKIGSTPTMKAINIGTPSKMAQVSFAKRSPKLQLKARPAKRKVKLKKLQAKRQKASKLKIKSLKSANV